MVESKTLRYPKLIMKGEERDRHPKDLNTSKHCWNKVGNVAAGSGDFVLMS